MGRSRKYTRRQRTRKTRGGEFLQPENIQYEYINAITPQYASTSQKYAPQIVTHHAYNQNVVQQVNSPKAQLATINRPVSLSKAHSIHALPQGVFLQPKQPASPVVFQRPVSAPSNLRRRNGTRKLLRR
jgi:hypothetical protein